MASLFGNTNICEKTFSLMNFNKSKWQTVITNEQLYLILKISSSTSEPRYKKLVT